jgi:SAM-dependent methyltransferase
MTISAVDIKNYYDHHTIGKLKGFVEGNLRVERAWLTIDRWAPKNPQRVLEVGCGIGDVCWRMQRTWAKSEVIGLDVSPKSLEIARKLFSSSKTSFIEGPLELGKLCGKFDLIVLMDVYEHIEIANRQSLHEALKDLRSDNGRVILSFPTPRHLAQLRQNLPEEIQPVDEDITIETIQTLAKDIDMEILLYQEVDVWHEGDYAHAVLGKRQHWTPTSHPINSRIKKIFYKLRFLNLLKKAKFLRRRRLALVHKQLGLDSYSSK